MLLGKLVSSGLFDKTVMRRLVSYTHYTSASYITDYDEYCVLPELENAHQENYDNGSNKYRIFVDQ